MKILSFPMKMVLRWFLYHATEEQIAEVRADLPAYFEAVWQHFVVEDR